MTLSHALIGEVAGVLEFVQCLFYIRATIKHEIKPDRVTWWIIALVSGMISVNYWQIGAHETIWLPVAYTLGSLIIAILSLTYGEGAFRLHMLDRVCLAGALLSALVWWWLSAPFLSLLMNVCTEFVGLIPTIVKAYKRPWTEDKMAWTITSSASLLNLFAIDQWVVTIMLYPLYVFVTNAIVLYPLVRNRKKAPKLH